MRFPVLVMGLQSIAGLFEKCDIKWEKVTGIYLDNKNSNTAIAITQAPMKNPNITMAGCVTYFMVEQKN